MDLERILGAPALSRRSLLGAIGAAGAAALLGGCGTGSRPTPPRTDVSPPPAGDVEDALAMYCWSDYINPDTIAAYRARFGVETFRYETYANNEELLAGLRRPGGGHDIAAPGAQHVPRLRAEGLIQKLDRSRIPNLRHIDPRFTGLAWDPTDEYQVPKDYGTTGILYRGSAVGAPLASWREFYALVKSATGSGRTVFVDSMADVFAFPLRLMGQSVNSTDRNDLDEARRILLDVAPHVLVLDSDFYGERLRTGEAVLALGWTGPLAELRADPAAADTAYVVPTEGTLFWLDSWVLAADAPHPNAAYAWLDFIHEPEVQGNESNYTFYATANEAATPFVDPELLADPAVFPPEDLVARLEAPEDTSGNAQRVEIWEEFRAKVGQG